MANANMQEYVVNNDTVQKATILCCECGIPIVSNPANMCVGCLRNHVDITAGIPKQATLQFCRNCERYLQPPEEWVHAALESRELLSICLKKLKGLNRVKLVDAGFVWTEPHSKRLKVKLTVNGEVMGGTLLQQVFIVEFVVNNLMCNDCHRTEAKDYWRASVQVRQNAVNKKTFYYLEQLILKHKAHEQALGIKPIHEGLDFFFANESSARKLVDFISSVMPCRYQQSKKLISHDIHSNTYNYKFTFGIEVVPISRDSVICLPKSLTRQLGGISPICLVYKMSNAIHIIDPLSAQIAEVSATIFWRTQFNSICNPKQMILYYVMEIEIVRGKDKKQFPGQGSISDKHVVADVWVVKASELGTNMNTIHTRTHLGHLLNVGDYALGYALGDTNINDSSYEKLDKDKLPDVILVKKSYHGVKDLRKKRRVWKLKHLNEEAEERAHNNDDYDDFMEDLEEDEDLRRDVRVYRDSKKAVVDDSNDGLDLNIPEIGLEEMLDDLVIEDVEMEENDDEES